MDKTTNEKMAEKIKIDEKTEVEGGDGGKSRKRIRLWPLAFFVFLLLFLFLLLRSFPLEADSYEDLRSRPALTPTVRMSVFPQNQLFYTGIDELNSGGDAVGSLLLYEMNGGKALLLVDKDTLSELSISANGLTLRGRVSKLDADLQGEIIPVLMRYYDLTEAEAAEEAEALVYVNASWQDQSRAFAPMIGAAALAAFCLLMSLRSGRKKPKDEVT